MKKLISRKKKRTPRIISKKRKNRIMMSEQIKYVYMKKLVPQLLFSGQIHPYADVELRIGVWLIRNVINYCPCWTSTELPANIFLP
jgi:hypothetical protein